VPEIALAAFFVRQHAIRLTMTLLRIQIDSHCSDEESDRPGMRIEFPLRRLSWTVRRMT
jgi:hypothetical protein